MIYFEYEDMDPDERGSAVEQAFRHAGEATAKRNLQNLPPCGCDHPYAVLKMERGRGGGYSPGHMVSACCARNSIEVSSSIDTGLKRTTMQGKAQAL
jgi:hypothetical protein